MRTIQEFIDEALERLRLTSMNKLSQALGYSSSGFLSQLRSGTKPLPEESEDHWIRVLKIPADQQPDFRQAAARSRANQKADVRDDYAELEKKAAEARKYGAALEAIILELLKTFERGKKPSQELITRIKRLLGRG